MNRFLPAVGTLLFFSLSVDAARGGPESPSLFAAIRSGQVQNVEHLVAQGENVNARDGSGATPLMYSAVYADLPIMSLLLKHGADVNARNHAGTTALMWSAGSPKKVKHLLEHGADVNVATKFGLTALVMAANLPDARETVEQLLEQGADVNANSTRFSPLMAASSRGDPDVVELLLRAGADAKARNQLGFSPLHGASFNGSVDTARLLLDEGIDPNIEVSGFTATMWAAVHGKTDTLRLLVNAGAKLNVQHDDFGTTPLLWASTTGHFDTIEYLVRSGVDVHAKDPFGNTALTWAKRRGNRKIIDLLVKARAAAVADKPEPRLPQKVDAAAAVSNDAIRAAIERSLPLLQRTGPAFVVNGEGCVSCHHQSLPAMAISLARQRSFTIDEKVAEDERQAVLSQLEQQREDLLQGFGAVDVLDPAYFLTGLAAEDQKANRAIDAAVHYLIGRQRKDGSWKNIQHRPPLQQSDIVNTALGIRCLQIYGLPGRSREMQQRIEKARAWLEQNKSSMPHDAAMRLMGFGWANAKASVRRDAADDLIAMQNEDGGWAQLPSLPSDSYATGIVLVALHEAGDIRTDAFVYKRGLRFLLGTQFKDGSWFVQTRSFPVQAYFDAEFPHERSQFISTAATVWSTMAMLHGCDSAPVALEDGLYPVVSAQDHVSEESRVVQLVELSPTETSTDQTVRVLAEPVVRFREIARYDFKFDATRNECTQIAIENTNALKDFIRNHIGERMAVVVNGQVVSSHKIKDPVESDSIVITFCTEGGGDHVYRHLKTVLPNPVPLHPAKNAAPGP